MKNIIKQISSFIEKNSESKLLLFLASSLIALGVVFWVPEILKNMWKYHPILGSFLLIIGVLLLIPYSLGYLSNIKKTNLKKNFIGYFAGFNNLPEKPRLDSINIPNNYEMPKINKIDSTNKNNITEKYYFWKQSIQERIDHNEATEIYLAILGSVPYTYLCGTLFCDGHLPLIHLEHDRTENKWKRLDQSDDLNKIILNYNYKDNHTKQACLDKTQQHTNIGLAISFTAEIKAENLPDLVRESTIYIKPNVEYNFDLLSNEKEQSRVAKEIAHFLAQLKSSNTHKTHLFISAQASFIARLGTLYQKNLHGTIVIYQWNANTQQYIWSIEYNGENTIATDIE